MKVYRVGAQPPPDVLAAAASCVRAGGTLIFPTDTVYGIGCAADDDRAVEAVFAAKRRPAQRPLSIHVADAADAAEFADRLSPAARAIARHFWPGPVTVIVLRRDNKAAAAARNGNTIGIRCPHDMIYRAIVQATGPLAATSANLSGFAAFTGEDDDLAALPQASMAIIAGPTKALRESTVLDCSGDRIRVVRAGAVTPEQIQSATTGVAQVEA